MNKFLLTALAVATMLPASAATYQVGTTTGTVGGTNIPVSPIYTYSGSQSLYTSTELTDLYKVNPDGSATTAAITALSVKVSFADAYYYYNGDIATLTAKVYLQNSDATEFVKDGNTYQLFDYAEATVGTGTLECDDTDDAWTNIIYGTPDYVTLTVNLSEPFIYQGQSIIVTWEAESDYGDNNVTKGDDFLGWAPGSDARTLYSESDSQKFSVAKISNTKFLPSLKFTYEPYAIEAQGGGEVRGEYTHLSLKNFDNPDKGTESAGMAIPVNGDEAHTFAQTLYTATQLAGLNTVVDGNMAKAEIDEITCLVYVQNGVWVDGSFEITLFAENTDAATFPMDGNKAQWFQYSDAIKGTATVTMGETEGWEDMGDCVWDDLLLPVTVKLDTPLLYEGQSILLTWITENETEESLGMSGTWTLATAGFSTSEDLCAVTTDNVTAPTGAAKNTQRFLPTLRFGYTPVITQSATKPVAFENIETALVGINDNTALDVTLSFDIIDEAAATPYEIKVNNVSLGTTSDSHVTIHWLKSSYKQDVNIQVVPAEGAMSNAFTLPVADIAALFPAPVASMTKAAFSVNYDAMSSRSASVTGVMGFHFEFPEGANVPVALLKQDSKSSPSNAQLITSTSQLEDSETQEVIEEFAGYAPKAAWDDLIGNEGDFAFICENLTSVSIVKGHADLSGSAAITFTYAVGYPVCEGAAPSLSAETPAEYTKTDVKVFCSNHSYSNTFMGRADLEGNTTEHVTLPDELKYVEHADGDITFFAPAGHKIYYMGEDIETEVEEAYTLALEGYLEAESNPFTLTLADFAGKNLHVYSADPEATEDEISGEHHLYINEEGNISGIADIAIDATDADARIFDLRGVEIHGTPAPGIYILRTATSAQKVIIR